MLVRGVPLGFGDANGTNPPLSRGLNGLELLSTLITNNIIGETSRVGFGSAIAVVLFVLSTVPIVIYLSRALREDNS